MKWPITLTLLLFSHLSNGLGRYFISDTANIADIAYCEPSSLRMMELKRPIDILARLQEVARSEQPVLIRLENGKSLIIQVTEVKSLSCWSTSTHHQSSMGLDMTFCDYEFYYSYYDKPDFIWIGRLDRTQYHNDPEEEVVALGIPDDARSLIEKKGWGLGSLLKALRRGSHCR